MLLLAIDTTTRVCSVALGDHEKILAEYQLNVKNTHSQRLMPLIVSLFRDSGADKSRLEGVALSIGPGSFTGIRIGMATAKGLCQGLNIPAVGVMTLDALAEACTFFSGLICPILDARKNQVYTALYRGAAGDPEMLQPAAALSIDELGHRLAEYEDEVIFLGDAVESYGGHSGKSWGKDTGRCLFLHASTACPGSAKRDKNLAGKGACFPLCVETPLYPSSGGRKTPAGKKTGRKSVICRLKSPP